MASIKTMDFDHLIGQAVGTSVLLRKLDSGAMSVVFVAFQKTLKRLKFSNFFTRKPKLRPFCPIRASFPSMKWGRPMISSISPCS